MFGLSIKDRKVANATENYSKEEIPKLFVRPLRDNSIIVNGGDSPRKPSRRIAIFAAAVTVFALCSCSQIASKTYDIQPVFPLSADKCAKYDGKAEGTGFRGHCWVTKEKCLQAASDWRDSMRQSGVSDAIQFSCN